MEQEKITQLITKLVERTEEGKITWEETAEAGTYQTSFPEYSIQVRQTWHEEGAEAFLRLYNQEGKIIEQLSSDSLPRPDSRTLLELYNAARRNAMGVEAAVTSILNFLD